MQRKAGAPIYSTFNVKNSERGQRGSNSKANSLNLNVNANSNSNIFDPGIWTRQFISNTSSNVDIIHSLRSSIFMLKKHHMKLLFLDNAKKNDGW